MLCMGLGGWKVGREAKESKKGEGGMRGKRVHSLPTYVLQGKYSFLMNPLFTSYMMMSHTVQDILHTERQIETKR